MVISERYLPWIVLAAGALVYLNALPGILFWDSEVLILNNVFLRSFRYLPEIYTTSVMAGGGAVTNYYRPIPVAFLLLQYQLWGTSPLGYHAVTILAHLAAAGLVFAWVRRLSGTARLGFWTALLFVLHPIQNETVNYVDHIEGILALIFGLLALILYTDKKRWLSLLPWAACLLCKEEGVVIFLFLSLYQFLRPDADQADSRPLRERLRGMLHLWPHASVLGAYVILKLTVFNFLRLSITEYGAQKGAYGELGLRLLTFAKALAVYAKLLLVPIGLHFDRDMEPVSTYANLGAWACAAGAITVFWLLWRTLGDKDRSARTGRYGLLCTAAALLPYSGLVPFNNILAEHFLYIPTIGLFLALVVLAAKHHSRLPAELAAGLLGGLLVFYAAQDFRRNRDWQDPSRLYETTLKGNPKSFRAANNLGAEYFRKGNILDARRKFAQALAAHATYAPALNNIGAVEEAQGNLNAALHWYARSAKADPAYSLAHKNTAGIHLKLKHFKNAEAAANMALRHYPQYADAWNLLGAALFSQHRLDEAVEALERSAVLRPSRAAFLNLALVYRSLGMSEKERAARTAASRLP